MSLLTRRALAGHLVAVTLTAAAAPPAGASACDRATLTLSDAAALAVTAQPLITGLDAQRQAAQASAVAAAASRCDQNSVTPARSKTALPM